MLKIKLLETLKDVLFFVNGKRASLHADEHYGYLVSGTLSFQLIDCENGYYVVQSQISYQVNGQEKTALITSDIAEGPKKAYAKYETLLTEQSLPFQSSIKL